MFGSCKLSEAEMKMDTRQTGRTVSTLYKVPPAIVSQKTNAFYKCSVFHLSLRVSTCIISAAFVWDCFTFLM